MKKLPETASFRISKELKKIVKKIVGRRQLEDEDITIKAWIEDAIQTKLDKEDKNEIH